MCWKWLLPTIRVALFDLNQQLTSGLRIQMADDDKPNAIPFAERAITRADLGPPADPTRASIRVPLNSVEAYGFESEAGPLQNCAEWIELRRLAEMKEAAN